MRRLRELVRQNSTASSTTAAPTTPPPTTTVPSKPIKGDTVFITGGKYANSEGTVMGGNEKAYRVQIPNLVDPGSIIAQVPIEMVTLVRPKASCSVTAPAAIEKNSNKQPKANARDKVQVDQDDKDSVDEFFSYLASSDKDYCSSDKSAPVVGQNSTVITAKKKNKTSLNASPHTTSTPTTAIIVPTASQSSEVSAGSVLRGVGGLQRAASRQRA
eukprot:gene32988-37261_t